MCYGTFICIHINRHDFGHKPHNYITTLFLQSKIHLPGNASHFNKLHYHIKTHDSESRGQEEAGRTRQTSELFTRSTALKFVNALNKPP